MHSLFHDKRKAITGQFFLADSRLKNRSRIAFQRIRGFKECREAVDPELHYHEQYESLVQQSFFNHVPNIQVLLQERYFEGRLDN